MPKGRGLCLNSTATLNTFAGDHGMQFSKSPLTVTGVRFLLLLARFFATCAFGAFADVLQVFQSKQTVGVLLYNMLTH